MLVLATVEPLAFRPGTWLVALGTSWHSEYLLKIRETKEACGIRYLPFVHDLIPVKHPEFCVADLTRDYIAWLLSVFDYADGFLTNSESTKRDLLDAAKQLGKTIAPERVIVIRLDAAFSAPALGDTAKTFLRSKGLESVPYVLFVSTVEPRKNHLAAFEAWQQLLLQHRQARIPKLVCAGRPGWMCDPIFARLEASQILKQHVVLLSDFSDEELACLYRSCAFTIYPSHYEGWGLPVTESLCYGKVPVIADNSSLTEAGGPFAVVYPTGSQVAFTKAIERLIFDQEFRHNRETNIAALTEK